MQTTEITLATIVEDNCLTLEQLATLCAVEPEWVIRHVEEGQLSATEQAGGHWCFTAVELNRARRMVMLERHFDALPELAALVADMQEELDSLRRQLQRAGL